MMMLSPALYCTETMDCASLAMEGASRVHNKGTRRSASKRQTCLSWVRDPKMRWNSTRDRTRTCRVSCSHSMVNALGSKFLYGIAMFHEVGSD